MATNSPMECGVCNEKFDENQRCPRILRCSHHLCTHCIGRLITGKAEGRKCPFCRAPIPALSATDVMINHGLLDLIKFMSDNSSTKEKELPSGSGFGQLKEKLKDLKEIVRITCEDYIGRLDNKMSLFENCLQDVSEDIDAIQQQNEVIDESILVKFVGLVRKNEAYEQRLNSKRDRLSRLIGEICEKTDAMKVIADKLQEVTSSKEVASLTTDAQEMFAATEAWMVTLKDNLCADENDTKIIRKDIAAMKTIIDATTELFTNYVKSQEESPVSQVTENAFIDIFKGTISVYSLLNMTSPIRFLIDREKVYTVHTQGGKIRSAKVTILDDKIFIHHLKDGSPPRDSYTVDYSDVMENVEAPSKRAFLEFYIGFFSIGRILINLVPDAPPAVNFLKLCTGELGPCYVNTKILEIWRKYNGYESLRMGDYEYNNGSGGKALPPGFQLRKEDHLCPWVAGTVWSFREDLPSQFCITTKNQSSTTCYSAFGRVVEGMDIIEKILTLSEDFQGITIKDSGIVLIPIST